MDGSFALKLSDFGLGCVYNEWQAPNTKCGSTYGISPECIKRQPYDTKVDCWALGIILFEILTSIHPFHSEDNRQFQYNIINKQIDYDDPVLWNNVSEPAKDLIQKLLQKDPSKRLSSQEILTHPWFDLINLQDCDSSLTLVM